jgi:hypothetical protein
MNGELETSVQEVDDVLRKVLWFPFAVPDFRSHHDSTLPNYINNSLHGYYGMFALLLKIARPSRTRDGPGGIGTFIPDWT